MPHQLENVPHGEGIALLGLETQQVKAELRRDGLRQLPDGQLVGGVFERLHEAPLAALREEPAVLARDRIVRLTLGDIFKLRTLHDFIAQRLYFRPRRETVGCRCMT